MLALSLEPDEYVTINGNIVVKVSRIARGRCFLAIEADRSIPIVRSTVLERSGTPPPTCINPKPSHKKPRKADTVFCWNDDRERAVKNLEKVADKLEAAGATDAAKVVRAQLDQIVPAAWEENLVFNR